MSETGAHATGDVYVNDQGAAVAWVNPGAGPVPGVVDAGHAIANMTAFANDLKGLGCKRVRVVQLSQPIFHVTPCTTCGSVEHQSRAVCCYPAHERLVAERGEGFTAPTDLEIQMMMGGNKYESAHDGRFPFRLHADGKTHLVEMPSLPLDQVRYVGASFQDIWDFPRLFVDGSSWVWRYAAEIVRDGDD